MYDHWRSVLECSPSYYHRTGFIFRTFIVTLFGACKIRVHYALRLYYVCINNAIRQLAYNTSQVIVGQSGDCTPSHVGPPVNLDCIWAVHHIHVTCFVRNWVLDCMLLRGSPIVCMSMGTLMLVLCFSVQLKWALQYSLGYSTDFSEWQYTVYWKYYSLSQPWNIYHKWTKSNILALIPMPLSDS